MFVYLEVIGGRSGRRFRDENKSWKEQHFGEQLGIKSQLDIFQARYASL